MAYDGYRLFRSTRSVASFCVWISVPSIQIQINGASEHENYEEEQRKFLDELGTEFFINEERTF